MTPGNYTVTTLMTALNASFAAYGNPSIIISYDDTTNKYTFAHSNSLFRIIRPASTMNTVLGFESAEIADTAFQNPQGSTLTTTVNEG